MSNSGLTTANVAYITKRMRYLENFLLSGNCIAVDRVHISMQDLQLLAALAQINAEDMPAVNGVCIAKDTLLLHALQAQDYTEYTTLIHPDSGIPVKIRLSAMNLRKWIYAARCTLADNNFRSDKYDFDMYSLKGFPVAIKDSEYTAVEDVLYYDGPRLSLWVDNEGKHWLWTALDTSDEFGFYGERNVLIALTPETLNAFMHLGVTYMTTVKQSSNIIFYEKHYYEDGECTPFAIKVDFQDIPVEYLPAQDYYLENGSICF